MSDVQQIQNSPDHMPHANGEPRTASSLVELLLVMAIVGVLLQLILPAIQSTREQARRLSCINNLRQLGTAAQLHVGSHRYFPSGGWSGAFLADPARGYGRKQPGSWQFSLLAYLDDSPLREGTKGERVEDEPLGDGLRALYSSGPFVLYCPSRRAARPYPYKRSGNAAWKLNVAQSVLYLPSVTKSDYAANSGDALYSSAVPFSNQPPMWYPSGYEFVDEANWTKTSDTNSRFYQSGVSYYRSEVRMSDFRSGTSHTYLFGEKFMSPSLYEDPNLSEGIEMMGDNQSAWVGFEWDNHRVAWNPKSILHPDSYQPQQDRDTEGPENILAFGSPHSEALNIVFCDGSVRQLSYEVTAAVHRQQANRR